MLSTGSIINLSFSEWSSLSLSPALLFSSLSSASYDGKENSASSSWCLPTWRRRSVREFKAALQNTHSALLPVCTCLRRVSTTTSCLPSMVSSICARRMCSVRSFDDWNFSLQPSTQSHHARWACSSWLNHSCRDSKVRSGVVQFSKVHTWMSQCLNKLHVR